MFLFLLVLVGSGMFAAAFALLRVLVSSSLGRKREARPRNTSRLPSADWLHVHVPLTRRIHTSQWPIFLAKMEHILDMPHWSGCGGLQLTDEIRHTVAAQAALLALGIPGDPYPGLKEILIYPDTFRGKHFSWTPSQEDDDSHPRAGESWHTKIVVLSWSDAKAGTLDPFDGRNVILHEFAHQLDTLDGSADGVPSLRPPLAYSAWARTLGAAFTQLIRDVRRDRPNVLDGYGATNPAEFFAVLTETFFEKPADLRRDMPEVYNLVVSYYGQDTLADSAP